METNVILNGEALTHLKNFEDECINCVMTSPPYWALRDYGVEGQLGLELTFEEYIDKLCNIFDEIKRVLQKDGTCWVNLGDTYGGSGKGAGFEGAKESWNFKKKPEYNFPDKSLAVIPFRFAIEMINRGWILRNTIIWKKPNCMPSSAKDRFTVDFEYLFFFSKSKKYWFETQYDDIKEESKERYKYDFKPGGRAWDKDPNSLYGKMGSMKINPKGRNKRTVWEITTKSFPEAHFAVYPEELCEIPIKSGCPEFICMKCGKAREKIIDSSERINTRPALKTGNSKSGKDDDPNKELHKADISKHRQQIIYKEKGYTNCNCKAGFTGGIVLDPFFGSGTTGLVALKQNKKFIGIELSKDYIKIAEKRLKPLLEQRKLK